MHVEDTDEEADMSAGELSGEEVASHGSVSNRLQGHVAHQTPQRTSRAAKNFESKNTPLKHKVGSPEIFVSLATIGSKLLSRMIL